MKKLVIGCVAVAVTVTFFTDAVAAAEPPAPNKAAPATPAAPAYSTDDTPIGDLLDDPKARAILDKYLPNFTTSDQIDAARNMTLKSVQAYAPDTITDEALAKIDAEFAALAAGK